MIKTTPANIDEYIAGFSSDVQGVLNQLRKIIIEAVPGAQEAIKYNIPTFLFHGNLIHFAAFKNHIGMYPAPSGNETLQKELAAFKSGKSTLQFSLHEPLPADLISKTIKQRVKERKSKGK